MAKESQIEELQALCKKRDAEYSRMSKLLEETINRLEGLGNTFRPVS